MNGELRGRVRALAAQRLVVGLNPVDAVDLAADLLAGGVDDAAVLALAIMPADGRLLRQDDVEPMFDDLCAAVGVYVVLPNLVGWERARSLATAIIAGDLDPGIGASHLCRLTVECGRVPGSDPTDMLQLFEEWERSIGSELEEAERRIIGCAHSVVREADRQRPRSSDDSTASLSSP